MSTSELQSTVSHGGGEPGKDSSPSPSAVRGEDFDGNDTKVTGVTPTDDDGLARPTNSLHDFLASLKKPQDGKYFRSLCNDGVFRILTWLPTPPGLPTGIAVYDGLPMSPDLIKAYLDRKPWNQETEDRFRGVDGRKIPQEQWLQPLPGVLPSLGSKTEREEKRMGERMQLEERIARGEMGEEVACGSVQSNYDLQPR